MSVFFLSINLLGIPVEKSQHYWEEMCVISFIPRFGIPLSELSESIVK
jgi:hypothetical protein